MSSSMPIATTSALYPLRLRADLDRDAAYAYWAGPHAAIAARLPGLVEYNQYHFSSTDHGYWPATPTVGTTIPADWKADGMTEVRLPNLVRALRVPLHMREVLFDEQNVFEHCLGHMTGPGGGRWWTDGHDATVGHRSVVLLRRRRGATARAFRGFVHNRLGAALHTAGARDVRSYTFLPLITRAHSTFGVSHHNPPHRRYHGVVVFGTDSRGHVEDLLSTRTVADAIAEQQQTCISAHAYTVMRTVPVVRTTTSALQALPHLPSGESSPDTAVSAPRSGQHRG
jgi:hypothetical protein